MKRLLILALLGACAIRHVPPPETEVNIGLDTIVVQQHPETEVDMNSDTATVIALTPSTLEQIEDVVRNSFETQREQAACVTRYQIHRVNEHTEISLDHITRANVYFTTDTSVQAIDGVRMCPVHAIFIHTHILDNGMLTEPSLTDLETGHLPWRLNPFDILLTVYSDHKWALTAYAWRK